MTVTSIGKGGTRTGTAPPPPPPGPPGTLSAAARDVWERLAPHVPDGKLTAATADLFAMLCVQVATWHEADQLVNDAGLLIAAGQDLVPSPALTIRVQADVMTGRWAKLFGLTPDVPAAAPSRGGMRHLREA